MRARPVSPEALIGELADRIAAGPTERRRRVAVDGAPVAPEWSRNDAVGIADPDTLAAALVDPLRVRGRAALWIRATDFLRPASLRLEYGREDPAGFYERWLDEPGLRREVLDRLGPDGSGRVLPSRWDTTTDRATRAGYLSVPPGGVVLVSGPLLLGGGLPFDLTIHLWRSPAALARHTAPERRWTLPAFARYEDEVAPADLADVVVRVDDPRHPAVVSTPPG